MLHSAFVTVSFLGVVSEALILMCSRGRLAEISARMSLHIALQDATGNKPGLACNSLMNELHQCLVFERFCKEAESSPIECGLAH